MRAPGVIEAASGLVIETADDVLVAGDAVMWRVAPSAVSISDDGAHAGSIDAVELRSGDPYAVATIGGMRFDIARDRRPAGIVEPGPARFTIDSRGVSAWSRDTHDARRESALRVASAVQAA